MNDNEKLMRAVGEIKDEYVTEAAETIIERKGNKGEYKASPAASAGRRGSKGRKGGWWKGAVALAACAALVIAIGTGGLGGGKSMPKEEDSDYYNEPSDAPQATSYEGFSKNYGKDGKDYLSNYDVTAPGSANTPDATDTQGTPGTQGGSSSNIGKYDAVKNAMMVYTASVSAQTTEYEKAVAIIKAMVKDYGGYIESQNESTGGYYDSSALRSFSATIRVPSENYEAFMSGLAGDEIVVYRTKEDSKDIGLSYYETEQRLKTLYTKEERLQELLSKATDLKDIITLEDELSENELMIDYYTQDLRSYTSLVNYSTITLELREVYKAGDGIDNDNRFGARLAKAFKRGFENFGDNLGYFVLWLAENLIGIIIFAAIAVLLIKFRPFTRLWRKLRKK